jgi:hypothetical protein
MAMSMIRTSGRYLVALLAAGTSASGGDTGDQLLADYRTQGAAEFSAQRGQALWIQVAKQGGAQSCATCHGEALTRPGKHARTGKPIEPLAPSVNPERLSDAAKVEKWFLRNCKGTWGRECTAQEKGDFLLYIRSQ